MFTCLLERLDSYLLGFFSFTRCIQNTLYICLLWLLSRVWSGKSQVVRSWGFLQSLLFEQAARVSLLSLLGGMRSCCRSFCCVWLSGIVMSVSSLPLLPVYLSYSPKFSDGLPCDCKRCPRKSCPCLLLWSYRDEEGLIGFYYLLSNSLF